MNNRSQVFWMTKVRPREQRNELSMLIYCYINKIKQIDHLFVVLLAIDNTGSATSLSLFLVRQRGQVITVGRA